MHPKQRQTPFTNIGSSSLLVVFLVLCLVSFSVLALASARSDASFSEKLATRKTAYYTAANRAEKALASIDAALTQNTGSDPDTAFSVLAAAGISASTDRQSPDVPCISFLIPIDERQSLQVTAELSDGFCSIRSWQTITDTDWESNSSVELLPID